MTTELRAQVQEINRQIIEDFYEIPLSINALKEKYGRSVSMINKILKQDRLQNGERERKGKPVDPRPLEGKRCLSFVHFNIGYQLSDFKTRKGLRNSQVGILLGKSRVEVTDIETGSYNLTLLDVEKIADMLGVSFATLISSAATTKDERQHALA